MILLTDSLEIEYKSMLTNREYNVLCEHFKLTPADFLIQKNNYFDLNNRLRAKGCSLRIREFATDAELTLKMPKDNGLMEYNQPLSKEQATTAIATRKLAVVPTIQNALDNFHLTFEQLNLLGSLTTKRAEFDISLGKLAIDESWYQEQHDFELELEVQETLTSKAQFIEFLNEFDIPFRKSESKVKRALKKY